MTITNKESEWLERAIDKEKTTLEVKKKLQENGYPDDKVKELVEEYKKRLKVLAVEVEEEINEEDEKAFGEEIKQYFEDKDKLSSKQKRQVKKFLKNVKMFSETLKMAIEGFKKEYAFISKQTWGVEKVEDELNYLKDEMIQRILECKDLVEVVDPLTKKEATEESLKKCNIDLLIKVLEDVIQSTKEVLDGKVD